MKLCDAIPVNCLSLQSFISDDRTVKTDANKDSNDVLCNPLQEFNMEWPDVFVIYKDPFVLLEGMQHFSFIF